MMPVTTIRKETWAKGYRGERYHANPMQYAKWSAKWRLHNPAKVLLCSARRRARQKGLPFDIELSDIIIPETCPVLGIPIFCSPSSGGIKRNMPNSPSLDRIRPELGYVKGNVRVISWRANDLRSDAKAAELRLIASDAQRLEEQ